MTSQQLEHLAPHPPPNEELPPLLTASQFYEALGRTIGINAIRAAIRAGRIRSFPLGRKRLIPKTELVEWLEREMAEPG